MNEELKPCPFCGQVEVHKPDCFFKLLSHATYVNKPERVKAWQFRPIEDALRADNARLKEAAIWVLNGVNGVGKAGREPESTEVFDAFEALKNVIENNTIPE